MTDTQFVADQPRAWQGYYGRIEGNASVFHLRYSRDHGGWWPIIEWHDDGAIGICHARRSPAIEQLVDAVGSLKRSYTGRPGGSFQINEFGQVLVPVADGSRQKFCVGEFHGRIYFDNPFEPGEFFHLGAPSTLKSGAMWEKPYIGIPFNLSQYGSIYRQHDSDFGSETQKLPRSYDALRDALVRIRGSNRRARFIINPEGEILTKKEGLTGKWQPVYVGKLDLKQWFSKQSNIQESVPAEAAHVSNIHW